jgi:hypothetical protein
MALADMILKDTWTQGNQLHFQALEVIYKKKNSVVLSPLANYTDRAIAAGQRS